MAIQSKHQVLDEAHSLLQRFQEAQNTLQNLVPFEQLQKGAALARDASLLTQLQNRVQASFLRGRDAIPEASEEELLTIAKKLSDASDILDNIEANNTIATDLVHLAAEVQSLFEGANRANASPEQAQLTHGRLIEMLSRPQINPGNRDAVEVLQAKILSYQQPVDGSIQTPPTRNADLINEQNESFEVTQFHDRWSSLFASLKQVYRNNLKNREFGKEALQNFDAERATIAQRQGASEHQNCEAKPTQPKTDSSGCFGIAKEDFNVLLPFYVELKKYASNKTQFVARKNKVVFERVLQSVKTLLHKLVENQSSEENIQAPVSEGLRAVDNRTVIVGALYDLDCALDTACEEMTKPNPDRASIDRLIQGFISKISADEKEKLFRKVSIILLEENKIKKALQPTLLGQHFTVWGADCFVLQKALKALQAVPSSAPPAKAVASPTAIAVESSALNKLKRVLESAKNDIVGLTPLLKAASDGLSENEKKELHNALSDVLIAERQITSSLTPALVSISLNNWPGTPAQKLKAVEKLLAPKAAASVAQPAGVKKASDEMAARLAEVEAHFAPAVKTIRSETPKEAQRAPENGVAPSIKSLLKVASLLRPNGSSHDLQEALTELAMLESLGNKVPFKISGNAPALVADRPCFHLYFIHKNESPDLLVDDKQYGNKAMAGAYPATNEQRTRAVQRTIMELVLEGLENAIHFNSFTEARGSLAIIQEGGLKLNTKDLPPKEFRVSDQKKKFAELLTSLFNLNGVFEPELKNEAILSIGLVRTLLKEAWKL